MTPFGTYDRCPRRFVPKSAPKRRPHTDHTGDAVLGKRFKYSPRLPTNVSGTGVMGSGMEGYISELNSFLENQLEKLNAVEP